MSNEVKKFVWRFTWHPESTKKMAKIEIDRLIFDREELVSQKAIVFSRSWVVATSNFHCILGRRALKLSTGGHNADVVELVYTLDLKSNGPRPCGFKSRRPHHLSTVKFFLVFTGWILPVLVTEILGLDYFEFHGGPVKSGQYFDFRDDEDVWQINCNF